MERRDSLIREYFYIGLKQAEILAFLRHLHNIEISERTLKRILRRLSLHRKKCYSNLGDVVIFLEELLAKSSHLHGYRWMHLKCLQTGLVVPQSIVRELLSLLDPEGVEFRKRKRLQRRAYCNSGPNFLWHMDSYAN